jgi:hypothetical protein
MMARTGQIWSLLYTEFELNFSDFLTNDSLYEKSVHKIKHKHTLKPTSFISNIYQHNDVKGKIIYVCMLYDCFTFNFLCVQENTQLLI